MNEWHYAVEGRQFGPIGEEELRHLLNSGAIAKETLVWQPGCADWVPATGISSFWTVPPPVPSVITVWGTPCWFISQAVSLPPCLRGRVSSIQTWMSIPFSKAL